MDKAKTAKIPVFTSIPVDNISGSLFDLGANYAAIGRQSGEVVANVLGRTRPGNHSRGQSFTRVVAGESDWP